MKEVELLFRLDKVEAEVLRHKLKDFFVRKIHEVDTYFYPPHRDFSKTEKGRENLRIRNSDEKKELTYKRVVYKSGVYSHSVEKSIEIADAGKAGEILKAIDFGIHAIVDKEREFFRYKDFLITIDAVDKLGIFAEIEWRGKIGLTMEEARQACMDLALDLELKTPIINKGYLQMLEEL
ncbi:TPA: class IV adenylate cyclase [Candidatus Woesearchaeota archaeon]|nr:class IV adenylate cyclase [Candidatus Woesearchaeota archaeon]